MATASCRPASRIQVSSNGQGKVGAKASSTAASSSAAAAAKAAGMKAIMVPDLLEANEEMHRLADDILPTLLAVKEQLCMEDSVG